MKKSLFENIQSNLNEKVNPEKLKLKDLISYYTEACEQAGLSTEDIMYDLFDHNCINVEKFRIMVQEVAEYLEEE